MSHYYCGLLSTGKSLFETILYRACCISLLKVMTTLKVSYLEMLTGLGSTSLSAVWNFPSLMVDYCTELSKPVTPTSPPPPPPHFTAVIVECWFYISKNMILFIHSASIPHLKQLTTKHMVHKVYASSVRLTSFGENWYPATAETYEWINCTTCIILDVHTHTLNIGTIWH